MCTPKIVASITDPLHGGADDLISSIAISLINRGWRVKGLTQECSNQGGEMINALVDLETGSTYCFPSSANAQQDQAIPAARTLLRRIAKEGADLALVNRFGEHEARGEGLAPEILEIMHKNIPVIALVEKAYLPAWRVFSGGGAVELPAKLEPIEGWLRYKVQWVRNQSDQASQQTETNEITLGAALAHGCFARKDRQALPQNLPMKRMSESTPVVQISRNTVREGVLAGVRQSKCLLQQDLAKRMAVSQAQVAQIERKADMLLSTLHKYVNGLGGQLELIARFPGVSYHLGRGEQE